MENHLTIALLTFTALVAAFPQNCVPIVTTTVIIDTYPTESALPQAGTVKESSTQPSALIDSFTTIVTDSPTAPRITAGSSANLMTIAVTNLHGSDLSISLASNLHAPSPIGNPSPAALPVASSTQYVYPTQWAGRICIGPNLNPDGSKIEASFTGSPDVDVSYVDGFTVPITCSSEGIPITGCNIDLFGHGVPCDLIEDGPVCHNPAQDIAKGPSPPFFAPCAGAAYTYPDDDKANRAELKSLLVTCCVGTSCKAPQRQANVSQSVAQGHQGWNQTLAQGQQGLNQTYVSTKM